MSFSFSQIVRKSLVRFVALGILVYACKLLLSLFFVDVLSIHPQISYAIVLGFTMTLGYVLNFHIVFRNTSGHKRKIPRFIITTLSLNGLDYILTTVLLMNDVYYLLAIFISSTTIILAKFYSFRRFVFNKKTDYP
jgi:putative flippase GtrA